MNPFRFQVKDLVRLTVSNPDMNTLLEEFFRVHKVKPHRGLFFGRVLHEIATNDQPELAPLTLRILPHTGFPYIYIIEEKKNPLKRPREEAVLPKAALPKLSVRIPAPAPKEGVPNVELPSSSNTTHQYGAYVFRQLLMVWGGMIYKYTGVPKAWTVTMADMQTYMTYWRDLYGFEPLPDLVLNQQLTQLNEGSIEWEGWIASWCPIKQAITWTPNMDARDRTKRLVRWWGRFLYPLLSKLPVGSSSSLFKQFDFPLCLSRPVPFTYIQLRDERIRLSTNILNQLRLCGLDCIENIHANQEPVITILRRFDVVCPPALNFPPLWLDHPPEQGHAPNLSPSCAKHDEYLRLATEMRNSIHSAYTAVKAYHSVMDHLHTCDSAARENETLPPIRPAPEPSAQPPSA